MPPDPTTTPQGDPREPIAPLRLRRGALVLLIVFWAVHLVVMLVRAELNDPTGQQPFAESFARRFPFALFGAILGYGLYRALRALRWQEFRRQMAIGAALALAAALVQGVANALVFDGSHEAFVTSAIYSTMYWFWFYFCWTTAYLAYAYSIRVQEEERRAAAFAVEAREAQVRALRYQINPHFLFNTLNAIATLVRDDAPKAEEMVIQLSDFFRRTLAVNPMEDLSLAEEVDLQRLYLEIERTRFPDRLRIDIDMEEGSAAAKVPALLLQPLVENAVKHGVARSQAPTRIGIRARKAGSAVEIIVENDCAPQGPAPAGERVGLRNVRDRLRTRFGDAASLDSEMANDGQFRNVVRIPLAR